MSGRPTPETDALRKSIDNGADAEAEMTLFAGKLERERDEAREELQKLEGAYEDATNYYARIIELREELDQVKEELKNKTYDKLQS
jgi:predicted ribosome quality control (RQC) complex YloA/Tae2 family protein